MHPLPAHLRRLSDSSFLGFGAVAFLLTLGIQYGLYHRLLQRPLLTHDDAQMRPAVGRWLKAVLMLQVVVVAASVGYVGVLGSQHPRGIAWIAPAIAAVFGTAIPLQVAVVAILRAGRGS
ncbi:MAG TPA: hypothetical protein VF956_07515 [Candidatus Dormibacteraeota bacterium]